MSTLEYLKALFTPPEPSPLERAIKEMAIMHSQLLAENKFLKDELRLYACGCKRSSSCLENQCGWRAARAIERK